MLLRGIGRIRLILETVGNFLACFMATSAQGMMVEGLGWQVLGREPFNHWHVLIVCVLLSVAGALCMAGNRQETNR